MLEIGDARVVVRRTFLEFSRCQGEKEDLEDMMTYGHRRKLSDADIMYGHKCCMDSEDETISTKTSSSKRPSFDESDEESQTSFRESFPGTPPPEINQESVFMEPQVWGPHLCIPLASVGSQVLVPLTVNGKPVFAIGGQMVCGPVCHPNSEGLTANESPEEQSDQRTTLMFRNLPKSYTRSPFLEVIDAEGFAGTYEFVYLPTDFESCGNSGYAFISFITHDEATRAKKHFHGFSQWSPASSCKPCDVAWSGPVQGLEAHVKKYQNSPVMHDSVPDEYRPAIFINGVRARFPKPTRRIRLPRATNRPNRRRPKPEAATCAFSKP